MVFIYIFFSACFLAKLNRRKTTTRARRSRGRKTRAFFVRRHPEATCCRVRNAYVRVYHNNSLSTTTRAAPVEYVSRLKDEKPDESYNNGYAFGGARQLSSCSSSNCQCPVGCSTDVDVPDASTTGVQTPAVGQFG